VLHPGHTLLNGQYRVLRFGFVYLAQDMLLGEQVAIKELIPALASVHKCTFRPLMLRRPMSMTPTLD
jgi:hypothetical protein